MTAGQQLGSLLIDMGFIDAAQLESALEEQQRSGVRLGKVLVRAGIITEERLVHALSRQLGIEPCDPIMTPIHERVLALVPAALAFKHHVLPIARQREDSRDCLYVATSDPLDKTALQALRAVVGTNTRVRWMLAGETEMDLALARHYGEAPKPSSDIPVIQGRPVSGPVDRASAFSTPPRGVSPPMVQSTADIAAALSVAMGETPLPASRMQSVGSKDLLPLSSGETSDDILIAEDVVESGAFPAVDELVDAVHRPAEVNLDDALAAAFDEEVRSAPPPVTDQATQQSGLTASSPFLGGESSRDPADVAIDEAFAGLTSSSESLSSNEAVDAALAGTSTDPGLAPEAPGDDDHFPPPDPVGAFGGVEEPRDATNGAVEEAPTTIPEPTAPEPAAQDVDTGPSWGDLLDPALSWGSSLTPTAAPTGAPSEDIEVPEPADSALPTMIAEPESPADGAVDAATEDPESATQTVDTEAPEAMFGPPGEMLGAPEEDAPATSAPQFGGSAEVPPAEVPPDLASTVSAERVTPDLANTVSVERVTPDLANTVSVERVQPPSAGAPAPNDTDANAPEAQDVDEAVVRALADVGDEAPGLDVGASADPSPPEVAAEPEEVAAEPEEVAALEEVAEPVEASGADVASVGAPSEPSEASADAAALDAPREPATADVWEAEPPSDEAGDASPTHDAPALEALPVDAPSSSEDGPAPPADVATLPDPPPQDADPRLDDAAAPAEDAPLPLGADAFVHAEQALDPDAPVPLPAEALVEAPSDADDLPDASEDIELAEVVDGPPTGEHVRTLVEQFAAGAPLDDEDTIVVMRALAAALLESGHFDDEHLAALVRRLTPPVT